MWRISTTSHPSYSILISYSSLISIGLSHPHPWHPLPQLGSPRGAGRLGTLSQALGTIGRGGGGAPQAEGRLEDVAAVDLGTRHGTYGGMGGWEDGFPMGNISHSNIDVLGNYIYIYIYIYVKGNFRAKIWLRWSWRWNHVEFNQWLIISLLDQQPSLNVLDHVDIESSSHKGPTQLLSQAFTKSLWLPSRKAVYLISYLGQKSAIPRVG